ncbi:MAG: SAM-dependent chlorinase/fluorinase [Candidatus Thiosymbion ectosymbiont of Robbea hypermnestra]|nr:SAM-dependent chlorinase/fluorinase [Candidatus Thiosymbion ectosymbiont of Robbea hypermnestra]
MQTIERIALVTDFGGTGPYVGQMKLRLSQLLSRKGGAKAHPWAFALRNRNRNRNMAMSRFLPGRRLAAVAQGGSSLDRIGGRPWRHLPRLPVIDLVSDLAPFRPDLAAYLLPALVRDMPARTLYLCVVDPGVGGARAALAVEADGNWYVGPDNGLLALAARRARRARVLRVDWRPERLSNSFHGRDLFAPIAAMLCEGRLPACTEIDQGALIGSDWPHELAKVIYADGYGNLITGLRACGLDRGTRLRVGEREIASARTFCAAPTGQAFWYENSFGLVELAVNQGHAGRVLGLDPGAPVALVP